MENNHTTHHAVHHESGTGTNMMALFAYLYILIVIPFLTDTKHEPFVRYHLRQGLVLVIFEVLGWMIGWIPFLGWLVGGVIWIVSIVLSIIGLIHVLNGEEKELPLIGKYAKNFKF